MKHDLEQALDAALASWLTRREEQPGLLPSEFAAGLPEALRARFLAEIEGLAEIDELAKVPPRDLPQRFGDFRILGMLGEGATGKVYEAEQVSLKRRVAIKVLHAHLAGDARLAARFKREAQTVAGLSHTGIVPVHAVGDHEGQTFLVMGLVGGRSLQRLLQARHDVRDLDHARATALLDDHDRLFTMMAEAAEALHYAHERGVVHRDIKPANLLIDGDGHVLVLDFGLATTLAGGDSSLTKTGDILGTPIYMAPEQAAGEREVDGRCDIYSLGAVLYECLSGRTAVAAAPLPVLLEQIRHAAPPPLHALVKDLPRDVESVVTRCLEKQRTRRYANAQALATDLRRLVAREPVDAKPVGALGRLVRRFERRPKTYAAVAGLVVIALGALGWAWSSVGTAEKLARTLDIAKVREEMSTTPEGIIVFGGASVKWYRAMGLLDLDAKTLGEPSAAAQRTLAKAKRIVAEAPSDPVALRLLASVGIDVGSEEGLRVARESLDRLVSMGPAPEDLAMRAVLAVVAGDHDAAAAYRKRLAADPKNAANGKVAYADGLYCQVVQDYDAAIKAFTRAIDSNQLEEEQRYFAFLHRGWCQTCPETAYRRGAEDDLLAAYRLRPKYATPRLLWGALRLLDDEPDDKLLGPVVAEVGKVLEEVGHAPWVVTLTARVLLAFAERSAELPGPSTFLNGLTPLEPDKIGTARRDALVKTALSLVEMLPDDPDAAMLRVVGAALQQRFADAEGEAGRIAQRNAVLGTLLRAKVALAKGHSAEALALTERTLALPKGEACAAAWLLKADLLARRGDARGEVESLERAVAALPQDAPCLPRLLARLVPTLLAVGELDRAEQLLHDRRFQGPASGGQGLFARQRRAEHAALLAAARKDALAARPKPVAALPAPELEDALALAASRAAGGGDALLEHGALLLACADQPRAVAELQKALAADPGDARVRALLALVYARDQDEARAKQLLRDAAGKPLLHTSELAYVLAKIPAPTPVDAVARLGVLVE